jgi:hypothetical protein
MATHGCNCGASAESTMGPATMRWAMDAMAGAAGSYLGPYGLNLG